MPIETYRQIKAIDGVISKQSEGASHQLDIWREIQNRLRKQEPELLKRNSWVDSWLKAQEDFLASICRPFNNLSWFKIVFAGNQTLKHVHSVIGQTSGGIYKRIDETRELLEYLHEQAPGFLERNPIVVKGLESLDSFQMALATCVPEDALHFRNKSAKSNGGRSFPRPWPNPQQGNA